MRSLRPFLAPALVLALLGCPSGAPRSDGLAATLEADVRALADDRFQGREMGSLGEKMASEYLLARFRQMGLVSEIQEIPGHAGESGHNVLAQIPGSREGAVVIGAHFDHLGVDAKGQVYYGADDNASGTAVLLALAGRFSHRPAGRTMVLAAFSGEEVGCFGSKAYTKHPLVPLEKTSAMINLDMVGRLRDTLIVFGADSGDRFREFLADSPIPIAFNPDPLSSSDNASFYIKGVPAVHLFTGAHPDYHKPTDTADKLNYAGMKDLVFLIENLARKIADAPQAMEYRKIPAAAPPAGAAEGPKPGAPGEPGAPPPKARPYFGSMPDYAYQGKGVRLDFVTPASPADKAGLKAGDVIVEFGGVPVTDAQSYARALYSHKPGDRVPFLYEREGVRHEAVAGLSVKNRSEE
jgi:hypothetical protein